MARAEREDFAPPGRGPCESCRKQPLDSCPQPYCSQTDMKRSNGLLIYTNSNFQRSPLSECSTEQSLLLLLLCRVAQILVSSRICLIKVWLQFGDLKTLICHLDTEILSKEKVICQKPALSKLNTSIPREAHYRFFCYKHPKHVQ